MKDYFDQEKMLPLASPRRIIDARNTNQNPVPLAQLSRREQHEVSHHYAISPLQPLRESGNVVAPLASPIRIAGRIATQRRSGHIAFLPKQEGAIGTWEALQCWGITILKDTDENPLYCQVQLPESWQTQPDSKDLRRSILFDEEGRHRAYLMDISIGSYKHAYTTACQRYQLLCYLDPDKGLAYGVTDGLKKVIYMTERLIEPKNPTSTVLGEYFDAAIKLFAEANMWLANNYPGWQNDYSYWMA